MSKSALIFGASGVTGWAFVNEILHDYPRKEIWGKVHALTNRPLKQRDSLWPNDERLNIISGIDLLKGSQEDLEDALQRIGGIENVTHVYYLAYKASSDLWQEYKDADETFKRSTAAMDHLCSALEFVVLQTGAKMSPYVEAFFYHPQLDWITSYSKDKSWNWCDTRLDIIIGFVLNQNFYSLVTSMAVFLSLWAEVEGKGSIGPYPGSHKAWVAKSNDSSSDMIARQTLYLSLTLPKSSKGEGFNVVDAKDPKSWEAKWPELCSYFGLKGIGTPIEGDTRK